MDVKTLIKKVLENLEPSQAADAAKVTNAINEAEVYVRSFATKST